MKSLYDSTLSKVAAALFLGIGILSQAIAAPPDLVTAADPATDPHIDPQVRAFLAEVNKDPSPFWELPGPQVRATLQGLQDKSPVDISGITISQKTISQNDRQVKIDIVKPENAKGPLPVLLFIYGGVWIAGDFEVHKRLIRDLCVGAGVAVVCPEYTPIPDAVYPTQLDQIYATATWVAAHGDEIGVDGSRMAVAGNSVGGNMSAAFCLMAKDRNGPKIRLQVLFVPATDVNFETESYRNFATGRFLSRAFMEFGWNIYDPEVAKGSNPTNPATKGNPYVTPLEASLDELKGLPPALVITAENDPLRDEGEAYARKLKEAGVTVTATRYNGTIHDFVALNGLRHVPSTEAALKQTTDALRESLNQ